MPCADPTISRFHRRRVRAHEAHGNDDRTEESLASERATARRVSRRASSERGTLAQVEIERDGHVMVVTMNRPKRKNAMTLTMFALMADAWRELSDDDELRCAILTGADGNFSSG